MERIKSNRDGQTALHVTSSSLPTELISGAKIHSFYLVLQRDSKTGIADNESQPKWGSDASGWGDGSTQRANWGSAPLCMRTPHSHCRAGITSCFSAHPRTLPYSCFQQGACCPIPCCKSTA